MSRTRRKHAVKMYPGQSSVVMDYDVLMYLAGTCDILAEQQENQDDANSWREIADEIRYQTEENYYAIEEEQEEDWI